MPDVAEFFDELALNQHEDAVDATLRLLGQPVLRKECLPVEEIDAPLVHLCHRMMLVMRRVRGLGVAAPQLGTARRLFVWDDGKVAINPVVAEKSGEQVGPESCLSMPGLTVQIRRAQSVLLQAVDLDGRGFEVEAEGQEARLFQHEVDHLNGVLTIDLLPNRQQKRDALRQLAKLGLTDRRL